MDRRTFLTSGLIGCSAAASPLLTPITLASAPWEGRLVVIILRGALDGLDAVRPWGDPDFAAMREELTGRDPEPHAIGNFFGLHPALAPLAPLWQAGELAVAHAVSTPYRDKRSHFDGQALLEAGNGGDPFNIARDGWLNRLLQIAPGVETRTAFAVGRDRLHVLAGDGPHATWTPNTALNLSPQGAQLLELIYHDDPLFRDAALQAMDIIEGIETAGAMEGDADIEEMGMMASPGGASGRVTGEVARFVVEQLRRDTRIAAFSINGWDTHAAQGRQITRKLDELAQTLLLMKAGLGAAWGQTAVLVMTEFGRTARVNGTKGTDHGTGGVMLAAGGAVRGGQAYGRWPGLGDAELYNRRDLMPVRDIRAYAGSAMRTLFGTSLAEIERTIFPGLDMGEDPRLLL
ncbi:MAG: DUF1501 domain-containing protein [Pseudomonadota bacterium]